VSTPSQGAPDHGAHSISRSTRSDAGGKIDADRQIDAGGKIDADCLKLTTYFGERDRSEDGLLGDRLLDIYGEHRLKMSVLLRGAEGFGRLHHPRTDRLLSLSEDLPVVSIAIDTRERIESILEPVLQIKRRGLITLERARLLYAKTRPVELPEPLQEAAKLTVYVGRQERVKRTPAFVAICELLHRHRISGATTLLGVDGTRDGCRVRAKFFARNADVPIMVIAVGSGERIAQVLPELRGLLREPLMTLERVRVCKRDGELLGTPHELPDTDEHGLALWQKLMVYTSQNATHNGRPLSLEIIRRLRESDAAGATSLRGIWGFHGKHAPHGDRFFQVRRHVPVLTIAIDTPERTARSFQIIDELTSEHGLVTSEMVPATCAISATERQGGLRLANHEL
jgi:PII-like signaling protein